mmetsp:Transcript_73924/g.196996  ORF Transcript_73924/g.196996 Transcript_73924/m.196996 type:complete len:268 (-) Transcript_73924:969-1772(-)
MDSALSDQEHCNVRTKWRQFTQGLCGLCSSCVYHIPGNMLKEAIHHNEGIGQVMAGQLARCIDNHRRFLAVVACSNKLRHEATHSFHEHRFYGRQWKSGIILVMPFRVDGIPLRQRELLEQIPNNLVQIGARRTQTHHRQQVRHHQFLDRREIHGCPLPRRSNETPQSRHECGVVDEYPGERQKLSQAGKQLRPLLRLLDTRQVLFGYGNLRDLTSAIYLEHSCNLNKARRPLLAHITGDRRQHRSIRGANCERIDLDPERLHNPPQ